MADTFSSEDTRELLREKFIFMLGGSNVRANYKDLVQLVNSNSLINLRDLRNRGEEEFQGDTRIVFDGINRGRGYAEGREFVHHGVHLEYHFISRCYNEEIKRFLLKIKDRSMKAPDIFIMNSTLWDISRWGPDGVVTFKENMTKLMYLLKECLPSKTLFIWITTSPVSSLIRGGLMIRQIDFLQSMLRFEIMEANLFCRQLIVSHGFDVLDTHYHLRMQLHRRLADGLHYTPLPVRLITNLILTHVSLSWGVQLPGRVKSIALDRVIHEGYRMISSNSGQDVVLPNVPDCLNVQSSQTNADEAEPVFRRRNTCIRTNFNRRGRGRRGPKKNGFYNNNNELIRLNDQNWYSTPVNETDDAEIGELQMYPAAQEESAWNGHHDGSPPPSWKEPPPPLLAQNPNFMPDSTTQDDVVQQAPWNEMKYRQQYPVQRRPFANFNRRGGPFRKSRRFNQYRPRPY